MAGVLPDWLSGDQGTGILAALARAMQASGPTMGGAPGLPNPAPIGMGAPARMAGGPALPGQFGQAPPPGALSGAPPPPMAAPAMPPPINVGMAPGMANPTDQSALPPMAAPVAGTAPPGMAPPPPAAESSPGGFLGAGSGGMLDRIMGGMSANSNAMLGLAAGIGQGRNWGEGLGKGFQNAATLGQLDIKSNALQTTYLALRQALIAQGKTPQEAHGIALAGATNPELLKLIAPGIIEGAPKLQETGTDPLTGQKTFASYNAAKQTLTPFNTTAGVAGATPSSQQLFDQIEQGRAAGQTPQQLIQTLPNNLRDGVDAMVSGRALPASLSMRGAARDLTVRLAHAVDPSFDETMIPMRTTFARGMAQTGPATPGGQKLLLNTALQHAGEASDALVDLHNSNGILTGVPGSGPVANAYNAIANSSSKMGEVKTRLGDVAQKLGGEVGKLYSGSSGGGLAEREATTGRFGDTNTPYQSVGALEATRNLILDKLNALQNQRDQAYGSSGENIHPLIDPQTKIALAKIDANIARLRGTEPNAAAPGAAPAAPAAAPAAPKSKQEYDSLPKGTSYIAPDGTPRTKS